MKRPGWTIYLLLLASLISSSTAAAQLKFPKIPRPRPNQPAPAEPQPATPTPAASPREPAAPAAAPNAPAGGSYVDDGFTWFESVSTGELDEKHSLVPTGWALKSALRLMGVYPKHSAFKVVVSRGGKEVVSTRCESSS